MPLKEDLSAKIAADREAGRDIPPVIEELFLMLGDFLEPSTDVDKPKEPVEQKIETENLDVDHDGQKPAEPVTQQ